MKNTTITYVATITMIFFLNNLGVAVAEWADSCEEPYCCETYINKDEWQFKLIGLTPSSSDMCDASWEECYQYDYEILSSNSTAINQVLLTFPYNYGDPVYISGESQLFGPGEGDDTTGLGQEIQELYVARIPPNSSGMVYTFWSNTNKVSRATLALKSGRDSGSCGIAGPNSCGSDPNALFTIAAVTDMATSDGRFFRIWENSDTQCIEDVCEISELGGTCLRQLESVPLSETIQYNSDVVGWEPLLVLADRNQKCFRAHGRSLDDEHTWVWISGRRVWR